MAQHRIVLHDLSTPLADPDAARLRQHAPCEVPGLGGRVTVCAQGPHGTGSGGVVVSGAHPVLSARAADAPAVEEC